MPCWPVLQGEAGVTVLDFIAAVHRTNHRMARTQVEFPARIHRAVEHFMLQQSLDIRSR